MFGEPMDYDINAVTASGIAHKAAGLVSGARAATHGDKQENHENIAALWTGYLEMSITAKDVANMMVLLKVARTKTGEYNPDDYMDAVGYAAIAGELAAREEAERNDQPRLD